MKIPKYKEFEISKYYQYFDGGRIHIIAIAKESDLWFIGPEGLFIAETRKGELKPISSSASSFTGWYEISSEIFKKDYIFEEYKLGPTIISDHKGSIPRFFLRIYENDEIYFFDLLNHSHKDGIYPNLIKNDYNEVYKNIDQFITQEEKFLIERILFERL